MTETVTVELVNTWFAPTTEWKKSKLQAMSGRRFKKGIYVWPVSVLKWLPVSAKIIKDEAPVEDPLEAAVFGGFVGDELEDGVAPGEGVRVLGISDEQKIEEQADRDDKLTAKNPDELLNERRANLAKANAANAAKRAAVKAGEEAEKAEVEAAAKASEDNTVEF